MPASLLDSQLATLEEPDATSARWACDINDSPQEIVNDIVARAST